MSKQKTLLTDFKIIGLRPLSGCKEELIKVLREDQVYLFYNDYEIDQEDTITYKQSYPDCLYDFRKTKINICAIAGKNGSGKSTIVDLLFMAINNIARRFEMKPDLVWVNGLKVELFVKIKGFHKIIINAQDVSVYDYDARGRLIRDQNKIDTEFTHRSMFYTICMNYSHYAYNANEYVSPEQEDWLESLFHKNDAYQTPLVINPWRDEGNIIINRENELVKSRLIANLLRRSERATFDFREVSENLKATRLILTVNRQKFLDKELYKKRTLSESDKERTFSVTYAYLEQLGTINKDEVLEKINKAFNFGYSVYKANADDIERLAMDYLIRKLITISIKYDEYKGNFIDVEDRFNDSQLTKYIQRVVRDTSHIAFKFKQTLNYLRHKHISLDEDKLTLDAISNEIQKVIDKKQTHKDKIIDLIPPPIFNVDIILEPINGPKKDVLFKMLSSGEKQMAYSMSSVLYHLSNLDSVSASTATKVKYKYIQIVLEEIELYFHPEMQRKYVRALRERIINLELNSIRHISICFVTHSPFILSDIPHSNIMFLGLEEGKTQQVNKNKKTFASNIHNLLADGFFMTEGLCGAFAIEQINATIKYLKSGIKLHEVRFKLLATPNDEKLLDLLEDLENDLINGKKEDHALLIRNVAEPVLASKLIEMYDQAFPDFSKNEIREQIAVLQEQLLKN